MIDDPLIQFYFLASNRRGQTGRGLIVTCAVTSLLFCSRLRAPNIENIERLHNVQFILFYFWFPFRCACGTEPYVAPYLYRLFPSHLFFPS